jgi:peptidoglycan hydrolase CwlO-like protein
MQYREHIQNKLESSQASLKKLKFWINRGNGDIYEMSKAIEECHDLIEEIKSIVEREPMTPNEKNKY